MSSTSPLRHTIRSFVLKKKKKKKWRLHCIISDFILIPVQIHYRIFRGSHAPGVSHLQKSRKYIIFDAFQSASHDQSFPSQVLLVHIQVCQPPPYTISEQFPLLPNRIEIQDSQLSRSQMALVSSCAAVGSWASQSSGSVLISMCRHCL